MAVTNVGYLFAKGLKKVMRDSYSDEPDRLEALIPNEPDSMAYVEWTARVGPGQAVEKPKGEEFTEKNIEIKDPKRVWHTTFGLQVRVPFEDIDDEQYGALKGLAQDVGRSIRAREAYERAMLLNCAFATFYATGYDGLAYYSASHTISAGIHAHATTDITASTASQLSRGTYTWSNLLATASDLDYVALTDAITLLKKTPSWQGEPMEIEPKYLVASVSNWSTAKELLGSITRPDTPNRSTSALNDVQLQPIITARLLDDDAWYVFGPKHDMHQFQRMSLRTKVNYDPSTWDYLTQGAVRFSNGFFDPRGSVGTPGV